MLVKALPLLLLAAAASALSPTRPLASLSRVAPRRAAVAMQAPPETKSALEDLTLDDPNAVCVDEICDEDDDTQVDPKSKLSRLSYAESSRQFRRTVYMHDEWVKHRSSERFFRNMKTIGNSGVGQNLQTELLFVGGTSVFVVLMNMLVVSYTDLGGVVHPGPLAGWGNLVGPFSLPQMPFTVAMPALSLLLVFRTNTGYARWNEARTLWGGVVNNCRNIVRQANCFYPETPKGQEQIDLIAGYTSAYAKALRNFLRGPSDDPVLQNELYDLVGADLMTLQTVDGCMAAKNRPMFMLSAMSKALRDAELGPMDRSRIDASISTLVDITGACERIFKSPVPLVYTRHTARFITSFCVLLPFGLWQATGSSWNHWTTIPATLVLAFFLFGIEEIGIQIEEPFSILPLEALCNGAILATMEEMVIANKNKDFEMS